MIKRVLLEFIGLLALICPFVGFIITILYWGCIIPLVPRIFDNPEFPTINSMKDVVKDGIFITLTGIVSIINTAILIARFV